MKQVSVHRLDARAQIAAIVLGTLGALTIMIVPGFVMLIGAKSALDDRQLGFVASWDINSSAVAIGLATFLISRMNWRHLALVGAALLVIGNLWTAASTGYSAIVAARVCAGFGEGLAIAVSFAALGAAPHPDRAFGMYLVVGLTVSAAVLALLPVLEARIGAPMIFVAIAVAALATAALFVWLPSRNPASASWEAGGTPFSKHLAVAGLVGVFLYFIAQGAVWSYFERIGTASAVDPIVIGQAMGLSSFAGVGGALLAATVCTRLGRVLPLCVSGAASLVSFWLLHSHVTPAALIASGIIFNFAWNLAQPLLSGICAVADSRGRVVVAMGCIQTVGYGIGPALAALMLRGQDFSPAIWMSMFVLVVSLIIVIFGLKVESRRLTAVPQLAP